MSRRPGASNGFCRTVPSEPAGPAPGQVLTTFDPQVYVLSHVQNCNGLIQFLIIALREWPLSVRFARVAPGTRFGRSFVTPSALSSVPVVMLKGTPLWIRMIEVKVQSFTTARASRLLKP